MNERIKDLVIKTDIWCDENIFNSYAYNAAWEEKFAELIIRECIDTVSDCSVEYCTRPQIVSEIKQHFGVEK